MVLCVPVSPRPSFNSPENDDSTLVLQFSGRNALQIVCPSLLEANQDNVEIWHINDLVSIRFPPKTEIDVIVWYRPTEGDDHVLSDPTKHVVAVRLSGGRPWPEIAPRTVLPTLGDMIGPNRAPATPPSSPARASQTQVRIVTSNNPTGTLCATNTLLQIVAHTPVLSDALRSLQCITNHHNALVTNFVRSFQGMHLRVPPNVHNRTLLHRAFQTAVPQMDSLDAFACLPQLWRSTCTVVQAATMLQLAPIRICAQRQRVCGHKHVHNDGESSAGALTLDGPIVSLQHELEGITAPFSVSLTCPQCNVTGQTSSTNQYQVLRDVLPIIIEQVSTVPTSMLMSLQFAGVEWRVTAAAEFTPDHWVAHVCVPPDTALLMDVTSWHVEADMWLQLANLDPPVNIEVAALLQSIPLAVFTEPTTCPLPPANQFVVYVIQ